MKSWQLAALLFLTFACSKPTTESTISYIEENGKAIAIRVSEKLLPPSASPDSLTINLRGHAQPVFGTTELVDGNMVFRPVVALTAGNTYEVYYGSKVVGTVTIDISGTAAVPALMSVYPTADTLPENLLKMYFRFSEPMEEGSSLRHITMLREADTVRGAFLELQPELWNEDGTILTLWLDPGRIKRDLIPNKEMGNPLEAGEKYTLIIGQGWRSKASVATTQSFSRNFTAGLRDETSPSPQNWTIAVPKAGTADRLVITFGETLDYLSTANSIFVVGPQGEILNLNSEAGSNEESIKLLPEVSWKRGRYTIEVEPRLEDPAGNNLTRLFDQDISKPASQPASENPAKLYFEIL